MKTDELLFPVGDVGVADPLLVTEEVAIGFVVVQVNIGLVQLLDPIAMVHEDVSGVKVPVIWVNVAVQLLAPVIVTCPSEQSLSPDQPEKVEPADGLADRVTDVL